MVTKDHYKSYRKSTLPRSAKTSHVGMQVFLKGGMLSSTGYIGEVVIDVERGCRVCIKV